MFQLSQSHWFICKFANPAWYALTCCILHQAKHVSGSRADHSTYVRICCKNTILWVHTLSMTCHFCFLHTYNIGQSLPDCVLMTDPIVNIHIHCPLFVSWNYVHLLFTFQLQLPCAFVFAGFLAPRVSQRDQEPLCWPTPLCSKWARPSSRTEEHDLRQQHSSSHQQEAAQACREDGPHWACAGPCLPNHQLSLLAWRGRMSTVFQLLSQHQPGHAEVSSASDVNKQYLCVAHVG